MIMLGHRNQHWGLKETSFGAVCMGLYPVAFGDKTSPGLFRANPITRGIFFTFLTPNDLTVRS